MSLEQDHLPPSLLGCQADNWVARSFCCFDVATAELQVLFSDQDKRNLSVNISTSFLWREIGEGRKKEGHRLVVFVILQPENHIHTWIYSPPWFPWVLIQPTFSLSRWGEPGILSDWWGSGRQSNYVGAQNCKTRKDVVSLINCACHPATWTAVLVQSTVFSTLHHSNSRWRGPGIFSHWWGEHRGRQFKCVDAQNCKTREGSG